MENDSRTSDGRASPISPTNSFISELDAPGAKRNHPGGVLCSCPCTRGKDANKTVCAEVTACLTSAGLFTKSFIRRVHTLARHLSRRAHLQASVIPCDGM